MPGPGILDALRMVQKEQNSSIGALIVAEMSSKGKICKHGRFHLLCGSISSYSDSNFIRFCAVFAVLLFYAVLEPHWNRMQFYFIVRITHTLNDVKGCVLGHTLVRSTYKGWHKS